MCLSVCTFGQVLPGRLNDFSVQQTCAVLRAETQQKLAKDQGPRPRSATVTVTQLGTIHHIVTRVAECDQR